MRLMRQDLHHLTGAYAVDALDGAEREQFEQHLRHCQSCDAEVRGLRETATRLGMASASEPPPGLRQQVLTRAARTRQLPPVLDARRRQAPRTRWLPRLAVTVAAAGLAAVIALAVVLAGTQQQLTAARTQEARVTAVLNAPDARIVRAPTRLGGKTTVVVSWRMHAAILTMTGQPALPDRKVYQLWLMGQTRIRSVGLVGGGPAAGPVAPVLASGLRRGDRVGVTVEPAGGTRQPTTRPIVVIPLSA